MVTKVLVDTLKDEKLSIKKKRIYIENLNLPYSDIFELISIFKYSNIGNVVVAGLTNLIVSSNFTGLALVFLLFVCSIIATIFVPGSVNKWTIMSSSVVPTFLNAGMSSQFTQLIFRLGECVSIGITPIFAYYIIYLAYLERGSQSKNELSIVDL